MSRNYAETLTDWYLRLNGFFTVQDFVLHPPVDESPHSSDSDILALRPSCVYEQIRSAEDPNAFVVNDWDTELDPLLWADWSNATVGLIVQVKATGQNGRLELPSVEESRGAILYSMKRLGLMDHVECDHRIDEFLQTPLIPCNADGSCRMGKLWVSKNDTEGDTWLKLSLAQAEDFIYKRFQKCRDRKIKDWDKFPDDLMQYILWRVERRREA